MKTLFIPAKAVEKVSIDRKAIEKLPKNIGLCTTVQLVGQIEDIKKQIEKTGRKVLIGEGKQIAGQAVVYSLFVDRKKPGSVTVVCDDELKCVLHALWPPIPWESGRCHTGVTRGVGTKRRRHGDYSLFLDEVGVAGVRFFLKESPFRLNL